VAFTAFLKGPHSCNERSGIYSPSFSIRTSQHIPHLKRQKSTGCQTLKRVFYAISKAHNDLQDLQNIDVISQQRLTDLCLWANRMKRLEMIWTLTNMTKM
jgi:hypothetical protein